MSHKTLKSWLLLGLIAAGMAALFAIPAPQANKAATSTGLGADVQSTQVEKLLKTLPAGSKQTAIVVVYTPQENAFTDAQRDAVQQLFVKLQKARPGSLAPFSYSASKSVAYSFVSLPESTNDAQVIASTTELRKEVAGLPDGLKVAVTGGPAFTTDFTKVFEGADTTLLLATVIVVAVLLIVTYRSPVLWIIPLVVVALAEQLSVKLIALLAPAAGIVVDPSASGIASVLVFGAGTDYALLLIARYKNELHKTDNRFAAMRVALRRTIEPIAASAATVTVSLCVLLLASVENTRAIGFTGAVGIVTALVFSAVVLPLALVACGRWIFWPSIPHRDKKDASEQSVWGKIGRKVMAHPRPVLAIGVVLLLGLSVATLGVEVGLSQNDRFRVKPEAVLGQEALSRALPSGAGQPVTVLVPTAQADQATKLLQSVDHVSSVRPSGTVDSYQNLSVVLDVAPSTDESYAAIADMRTAVQDFNGLVGGQTAAKYDLALASDRDQWLIAPIILVLVSLVLLALLRSIVATIILMLSVILTYTASVGASWLVFQGVYNIPALDTGVLLLSFLFLIALGVDYNIFLATRAKEESESQPTPAAMLTALRVTGGVITSAGILLAAVFAVLGVLPLITLTQIGVIVGIGVLLDTLLVRTVLVPASAFIAGRYFWWPRVAAGDRRRGKR
jgi:putative drug exporter of the RND superfamily